MATIDIDIVPDRTTTNLANLAAALKDLDARIRAAGTDGLPFGVSAEFLQGVNILNLTTRFADLDLAFSPGRIQHRLRKPATGRHCHDDCQPHCSCRITRRCHRIEGSGWTR